jgi:hypothetical protein
MQNHCPLKNAWRSRCWPIAIAILNKLMRISEEENCRLD